MALLYTPQRPALTFAVWPMAASHRTARDWSQSHTGNSGKKNSKRWKKPSRACYGVRVKETRISTLLLYQLNQYLWIEHSQVLEQVESLNANSRVSLKIISFLSPVDLRLSFQIFCSLFLSLGKRWTLVLFLFDLCFNCSFYPCGPWWLRTVILWWCSLGQQLVQMGVNWVRMKGK